MTSMQMSTGTTTATFSAGAAARDRVVLEPYFRELESESLMSAAGEHDVASRVVASRIDYWKALLSWAPLRRGVATAAQEAERSRAERTVDVAALEELARSRRSDPEAVARLAASLAHDDPSSDVADMLYADLEALCSGAASGTWLRLRKSQRSSEAFTDYANAVRRARLRLHTARAEFARANLRLVVKMANRYRRFTSLALADLIQEGNLGLLTAIDRFDPSRGFRFSTYASWWIRHAIRRSISDRGRVVRVPVHVLELRAKVRQCATKFEQERGRAPSTEELAGLSGYAAPKIEALSKVLLEPAAAPTRGANESTSLIDTLPAESISTDACLASEQLRDALSEALDELRPMEAEILRLRFGLEGTSPMKLREIGAIYSLSRERIRQLQERALTKLRGLLAESGFDGMLPV